MISTEKNRVSSTCFKNKTVYISRQYFIQLAGSFFITLLITGILLVSNVTSAVSAEDNRHRLKLPESDFLSDETRKAWRLGLKRLEELGHHWQSDCDTLKAASENPVTAIHQCMADTFYASSAYSDLMERYAVDVQHKTVAGVNTKVFIPALGIDPENKNKVLINLHGGGFINGSPIGSYYDSVPIAAVGKIKVISIDYRIAPQYRFPAASDDVLAVYTALLRDYKPENIGIYGCSAGAILTAQSIARFQREGLPMPAAAAMLCAGASAIDKGDSVHIESASNGRPVRRLQDRLYFEHADANDPLVTPGVSDEIMKNFPPSLLVTSTRDSLLSSTITTHAQLIRLGVEADLHVFEGLEHAFMSVPELPESQQVFKILVNFFNQHLSNQ